MYSFFFFLIISLPSNYFSIFHHIQWRNSQFPPSTFISGEVLLWLCIFFPPFSHIWCLVLTEHAGLWTVFQVVLWQNTPLPRGHELPCHLVVWRSVRRRIITIPQRWLTSMIWDRLSNREYTYVMVLTWESEKKTKPRCVCGEVHWKSFFPQRGILWDIPGKGSEHSENVHL